MRASSFFLIAIAAGLSAAPAAAQESERPTLTVYTYDSFVTEWGPGPRVETAFEQRCGCNLELVGLADGVSILNRLRLEGESTDADVVLGLDTSLITEAKATGLFAESGVDTSAVTVPGGFSDPVFVPYDYGYFAIVYDAQALENPPQSLEELVTGDPETKVVIQDPRTSTPGLGLLLWMKAVYGEEAGAKWAEFSDRILTVTPGWSEAYGLLTNGEAPMVLSYTTSPAYHMIEEGTDRYRAAAFEEGHYIQVEVAGRIEGSDQPELAKEFLSFLTTPEFQSIIPTTNWMLPAAPTGEPLPDAFDRLVTPEQTLSIAPEAIAKNRDAWTEEWLRALAR